MSLVGGKLEPETVKAIQTRLAELGYYRGEIHGDLDDATMSALGAFQKNSGQSKDGIANLEKWPSLFDRDDRLAGYSFEDILTKELVEVALSRKRRLQGPPRIAFKGKDSVVAAHEAQLVGLAFSGGGVRSATFNLGVLQALAELKLLGVFDYLSTVSGGGYIGSWLSALIRRENSPAKVEEEIAAGFSETRSDQPPAESCGETRHHAHAISFLRRYSNYITPKAGLFSGDTWCVVSTYLRNLMLNLIILSAGLGGLLLIPRLLVRGFKLFEQPPILALLVLTAGLVAVSLFAISINLVPSASEETDKARHYTCAKWIHWAITLPVVMEALFISYLLAFALPVAKTRWFYWALWGAAIYLAFWLICWLAGHMFLWLVAKPRDEGHAAERQGEEPAEKLLSRLDKKLRLVVPLSAPFAGAAGGLLIFGSACLLQQLFSDALRLWQVVILGPPLILLVFSATVALHIGLMGRDFPEAKREWWSRLGGWLLIVIVVWVGWFGIVLYAPLLLHSEYVSEWVRWTLTSGWLASTLVGVLVGKSQRMGKPGSKNWLDLAARITPAVFVAGMLALLSVLTDWLLNYAVGQRLPTYICDNATAGSLFSGTTACHIYMMNLGLDGSILLGMFLCLAGLTGLLSWRVDINEFSLHHLYRNRLIRCYLGASNRARNPQPFTGFCRRDDFALHTLAPSQSRDDGTGYCGPYPIINAALNLVAGKELAWQQRKAASFVFTPRFCGYELPVLETVRDPCRKAQDARSNGCYRPTNEFANAGGGISLGTALAISGAAASPNMGYHSSPALAFLLTVFNVRLGWWLGNPAKSKWQDPGPRFGLKYLAMELFGLAGADSDFVYLSDGGHFENLGLYELVRRRCRLIVAGDATQDPKYAFGDLGDSIRKCYADLGIEIEIDVSAIQPQSEGKPSLQHHAVGVIHYERVDRSASPGILVYLKASLTGDEPTDLFSYHARKSRFPHQSTADQWFDESQFESYRKLGYHVAKSAFREALEKLRENSAQPVTNIDGERFLRAVSQSLSGTSALEGEGAAPSPPSPL